MEIDQELADALSDINEIVTEYLENDGDPMAIAMELRKIANVVCDVGDEPEE